MCSIYLVKTEYFVFADNISDDNKLLLWYKYEVLAHLPKVVPIVHNIEIMLLYRHRSENLKCQDKAVTFFSIQSSKIESHTVKSQCTNDIMSEALSG